MGENLPRLARELRKETCPPRVLDEVGRRISAQASPSRQLPYGIAAAVVGLVLLCCLAVWRPQPRGDVGRQAQLEVPSDPAKIAGQAEGALGFIGSILLEAGAHSEKVLSERAVPPLRNGFETTKNKITHRIELWTN